MSAIARLVIHQANTDETRRAGAIVVFGAAEYHGRPSPVYRARLDHAYDLFRRGVAPLVITTGGSGGSQFSEGAVGRDYLAKRGIAERFLIAETLGRDTAQSAQRVARILRANSVQDCIAVSDAYHMYRVKQLMAAEGVRAYASPRPASIPNGSGPRVAAALREGLSFLLWKLDLT